MLNRFFCFCLAAPLLISLASQEAHAYSACGTSSWYGAEFEGQRTANGERFNAHGLTAAHRSLPFGTKLKVVNQANGRSVRIRVNDSGPYAGGRILDLSYGAFSRIAAISRGTADVCIARL
mgnify:CR=1 FL=1